MQETIINAIVEGIKQSVVNFLKWIGLGIINGSYWICLIACLVAIILYIAGQRKAGKYVSISFVIYVVLQSLKGVLI